MGLNICGHWVHGYLASDLLGKTRSAFQSCTSALQDFTIRGIQNPWGEPWNRFTKATKDPLSSPSKAVSHHHILWQQVP